MTINFKSLGWYLFTDFLIIGAFRIYAPDYLSNQNIIVLLAASVTFGCSLIGIRGNHGLA